MRRENVRDYGPVQFSVDTKLPKMSNSFYAFDASSSGDTKTVCFHSNRRELVYQAQTTEYPLPKESTLRNPPWRDKNRKVHKMFVGYREVPDTMLRRVLRCGPIVNWFSTSPLQKIPPFSTQPLSPPCSPISFQTARWRYS